MSLDIWRDLPPEEESEFRKWTRENYHKGDVINELWHPVVRDECNKINADVEKQK